MLRIFRFDGLMLTQEELLEEANRIIQEFQKYTKDFQVRGDQFSDGYLTVSQNSLRGSLVKIVDSFYHGTYGRCVRFSVVTTEGESYRVLFHQTGLSVLNDSSHFESFEQFFNSKSPNYRNDYQKFLQILRRWEISRSHCPLIL